VPLLADGAGQTGNSPARPSSKTPALEVQTHVRKIEIFLLERVIRNLQFPVKLIQVDGGSEVTGYFLKLPESIIYL
jgi:hypothetical protein